jgi:hypothetical protein
MLQTIGMMAIGWLAVSALVVAIAMAAGRADRSQQPSASGRRKFSGPQLARAKTRHARSAARTAADHRMRSGMRAAVR